jgi:aldehyde dehydrogenase (NAD+)
MVNAMQADTSRKYVEIALAEGAKLLTGGHPLTEGVCAHGSFFAPTVLGGVNPAMRIAREEVFGPVVSSRVMKKRSRLLTPSTMDFPPRSIPRM